MWIHDVELPAALVEAHHAGRLVLFVGAGASVSAPSNLPLFGELAARIAAETSPEASADDLKFPDTLLGRLEDESVDVHKLVATHINLPGSEPNALHDAIVALAAAGPPIRIVTTNYDRHLSAALGDRGIDAIEYAGPALPMGDDFTGLVYLHGSLLQEPRHLVVTDADFGRAYLRDAWATRFLERMFGEYTVLFIGYSHADVVMRYLGRALGPRSARYILTPEPGNPEWRRLGLNPVAYRLVNDSHDLLSEAIQGWAQRSDMGLLNHRQRIAQLVSSPPSQVPEDVSYMEVVVADANYAPFFAEFARDPEWLAWISTQHEFRRLFDERAMPTGCTWILANWFAENYVIDDSLGAVALATTEGAGGRLGPTLWSEIGRQLYIHNAPRGTWFASWITQLIDNDPGGRAEWLEYALLTSRWPADRDAALVLFDHLAEPHLVLAPSFGQRTHRFELRLRGSRHSLEESWARLFAQHALEAASDVLPVVDRHLRHAYRLLAASGTLSPGFDPLSYGRSAIESEGLNRYTDDADILIDAARDCLDALLEQADPLGTAYLTLWASTDAQLLRRLTLHGWTQRTDVSATAKITWLRERRWLFDHELRHEAFRLIAAAIPATETQVSDGLVGDVADWRQDGGTEDDAAYDRFTILSWITQYVPDLRSAQDALQLVRADHPEFVVHKYLDRRSWSEVGFVQPRPPMSTADLIAMIDNDASSAVAELRRYENVTTPFDGPTWDDAVSVLRGAVKERPDQGFAVLTIAGLQPDLVRAVIAGWSRATVDDSTATAIAVRLRELDIAVFQEDLAQLLGDGGSDDEHPTSWHRLPIARALAEDIWEALPAIPVPDEVSDWLTHAINTAPGRLTLFWLHGLAADWRVAGDSWTGLPAGMSARFETLLGGDDYRTTIAEIIVASQLHFIFAADVNWSSTHVLPLLHWSTPLRAQRTWQGYLTWGSWSEKMLEAGLWNDFLDTVYHLGEFGVEPRRRLHQYVANIAVYGTVNTLERMRQFTTVSVKAGIRDPAVWLEQVSWLLRRLPSEAVEELWKQWIEPYWVGRISSIPVQLTNAEASAMALWVPCLTTSLEAGVAVATQHPAGLDEHADLLRELDHTHLARNPSAYATLLVHLLRYTTQPFYACSDLATIVSHLRELGIVAEMGTLAEYALRLGCGDAPNW